jgi:hypothetical protein
MKLNGERSRNGPELRRRADRPAFDELYSDSDRLERLMDAVAGVSASPVWELAQRVEFPRDRTLCDVGGATGNPA